jgi:hypothetical protein
MKKSNSPITALWNQSKESFKNGDMVTFQESIEKALVLVGQATLNGATDKDLIEGVKNETWKERLWMALENSGLLPEIDEKI